MSTLSMILHYGYFFHATELMTTFFTLLRHTYFLYDAPLCLLFPRCSAITTFSTQLRYDSLFHDSPQCLLFNAAALCLLFPRCCTMTPFSTLLGHDCYFHATVAMSTFCMMLHYDYFSTLLRYVYFSTPLRCDFLFHDAPQCLLFQC